VTDPDGILMRIETMAHLVQAMHDRRAARWRTLQQQLGSDGADGPGSLDGVLDLTTVMHLWAVGQLPRACHLRIGPDAWQRQRERWLYDYHTSSYGAGLNGILSHLDAVDVFTDVDMGDRWQLWTGRIMGQGELIAYGVMPSPDGTSP
jgi:hypothetical protein